MDTHRQILSPANGCCDDGLLLFSPLRFLYDFSKYAYLRVVARTDVSATNIYTAVLWINSFSFLSKSKFAQFKSRCLISIRKRTPVTTNVGCLHLGGEFVLIKKDEKQQYLACFSIHCQRHYLISSSYVYAFAHIDQSHIPIN